MSALIEELKGQHAALKSMLLMFQKTTDRNEHLRMLAAAKRKLEEHLQLEDAQLYPFLRAEARDDRDLNKMLEIFDEDMRKVSGLVMAFFTRYEGGWDNDYEFLMDLSELTARLSHRIETEEKHLYPEYLARKANPRRKMKKGWLARLRGLLGGG